MERANLISIQWNNISFLVAMIGTIGSHLGCNKGNQNRENENSYGVLHRSSLWGSLASYDEKEESFDFVDPMSIKDNFI